MTLAFTVGGCRGSMCVSGSQYRRYGGNTTCYYVEVEPGHYLVVDAGTGLRNLQHEVRARPGPKRFSLFLTHYHWDHIQGLPVFGAVYDPSIRVDIYGPPCEGKTPNEALGDVMKPPWWPVPVDRAAGVNIHLLDGGMKVGAVRMQQMRVSHPQTTVAYRLEADKTIVIATDHEAGERPEVDEALAEFASGADVLFHDSQYTPEEHMSDKKGWGHSDWEQAAHAAKAARVGRLILTSHDPDRTDEEVDVMRTEARRLFTPVDAAYEGMTLPL
ncbi:MAG TPA: MBL fold metallo-hydrolase [Acidimicrobiia bacterium]|nr:MBL fold metallo-hydrolase [Acidimicrobiia bacterium]